MAAAKKKATKTAPRRTLPARHDGPVLALAFAGDALVSSGADGRVLRFAPGALRVDAVLRDDADDPAGALAPMAPMAPMGRRIAIGSAQRLVVMTLAGETVAQAELQHPCSALVARGEQLFALGGGKVTRFELSARGLRRAAVWPHGSGVASQLDVDDACKRAVVVRDHKTVELIDLVSGKSLAEWARKGADEIAVRFAKKPESLLAVEPGTYRVLRLKATTGRVTGEMAWLDSSANSLLVVDGARRFAAVRSTGEDVEVVDVDAHCSLFVFEADLAPQGEKALASMTRVPRFAEIAPGMFVRKGSTAAPRPERSQTALCIAEPQKEDGDMLVAAGYVSGEIILAQPSTARVDSTHRGALFEPRCRAVQKLENATLVGSGQQGTEVWLLAKDGTVIADLASMSLRPGPRLEVKDEVQYPDVSLSIDDATVTYVSRSRVVRWRKDGTRSCEHALPKHRGAIVHGGAVLFLPEDAVAHEGFDLRSINVDTGEVRTVLRFERDVQRFPLGNNPREWVRLDCVGDQPTLTFWAGKGLTVADGYAFDVATGTLGASVPWAATGHGRFTARSDPREGIAVHDVATGEIVTRVSFTEREGYRGQAIFDPESRVIAGNVTGSRVGVWNADGTRRLTLPGHRDARHMWIAPGGRALLVHDVFSLRLWDISA